ncbi:hypothetical protein AMECASPLE_015507 [Ameca splendens]|uniref:Uncharacterized protein n=1 Tax=Ameca splendens TaxID=208324 RepID=A0ABV0ZM72_9TELE
MMAGNPIGLPVSKGTLIRWTLRTFEHHKKFSPGYVILGTKHREAAIQRLWCFGDHSYVVLGLRDIWTALGDPESGLM